MSLDMWRPCSVQLQVTVIYPKFLPASFLSVGCTTSIRPRPPKTLLRAPDWLSPRLVSRPQICSMCRRNARGTENAAARCISAGGERERERETGSRPSPAAQECWCEKPMREGWREWGKREQRAGAWVRFLLSKSFAAACKRVSSTSNLPLVPRGRRGSPWNHASPRAATFVLFELQLLQLFNVDPCGIIFVTLFWVCR